MSMNRKEFDAKRQTARTSTLTLKAVMHELACAALAHFGEHGDTSYIHDLNADMKDYGKNFLRSNSFIKWAVNFSPLKLENGKFSKDKAREAEIWPTAEAKAAMLAKAEAITFWDFDPETSIKNFEAADLIEAVNSLIKRFENTKTMKPKNADATAKVVQLKTFAKMLETGQVAEPTDEQVAEEQALNAEAPAEDNGETVIVAPEQEQQPEVAAA